MVSVLSVLTGVMGAATARPAAVKMMKELNFMVAVCLLYFVGEKE
jgi:hypothetical protein